MYTHKCTPDLFLHVDLLTSSKDLFAIYLYICSGWVSRSSLKTLSLPLTYMTFFLNYSRLYSK